jgi:phosphate:Na+ symporter
MEFLTDFLMSVPVQLASAIFIFLFGLHFLSEGLKTATQGKLKVFFDKAIKNRVMGTIFGTIITGFTQSSTAVSVMTVGFVNAGVMSLMQAASIIVGANIGTTLTGHMMTIRFDAFTPILMLVGGVAFLFVKKEKSKQLGMVLFGFGLFFIGLTGMSDAMRPLRDSQMFIDAILWLDGRVILGIVVGALITAILNSSTASKGIFIMLAYQGIINFNIALPLIFGMNIGTCFTALLSSFNANKNAKRVAVFHLLFSVIGTLLFLPFITPFANFIVGLNWPGDAAHYQVANAHTIFNIVTALILLPFLNPILKFINLFIKEDKQEEVVHNPLDDRLLDNPAIAFEQAINESLTMYELAKENLEIATDALINGDTKGIQKIYENESLINKIEHDITDFLVTLPTGSDKARMTSIIKVACDIERIGDHARNIAELAIELKEENLEFSQVAIEELETFREKTLKAVSASFRSYKEHNLHDAINAVKLDGEMDALEELSRDKHFDRMKNKICKVRSGTIFLDTLSNFERIRDHAVNISEQIIEAENTHLI